MHPLLNTITDPAKLRTLERKLLPQLADELRQFLVESVAKTGGHLSSNLGTVELTIALHYVFNTPYDRLVWDVGHQTYVHKILTGRREGMSKLRMHPVTRLDIAAATFGLESYGPGVGTVSGDQRAPADRRIAISRVSAVAGRCSFR